MATWTNQTDAAIDHKLGLVSVRLPFSIAPGLTKMATLIEALTFYPPDLAAIGIPLVKRDLKERGDCGYDVAFSFDGHMSPETADGEEYSMDGTTSVEKLASHPRIDVILDLFKGRVKKTGEVEFAETIDNDGETIKNPILGTTGFYFPGCVWTCNRVAQSLDSSVVEALGFIDTPRSRGGISPPTSSGEQNWLKIRGTATYRGNIWKITESWLRSGEKGWNPYIYGQR